MDASAIMQDDTSIENMRAMTDFTREISGIYSSGSYKDPMATPPAEVPASVADREQLQGMSGRPQKPGAPRRLLLVGGQGQGPA